MRALTLVFVRTYVCPVLRCMCVCAYAIDCKCVSEYDGNVTIPLVTLSSELNCADRMNVCAVLCYAVFPFSIQRKQQLSSDKARERNEISPKFRCTYLPYIHHRTMVCLSSLLLFIHENQHKHTLSPCMYARSRVCLCECVFTQQSNKRLCGPYKIVFSSSFRRMC